MKKFLNHGINSFVFIFMRVMGNGKKIVSLLLLLFVSNSFAALHLELTQGIDTAVPIAVLQFGAKGAGAAEVTTDLNQVMRQDFINTGQFSPVDTANLQQPHNHNQVHLSYWQQQKVNDLIIGQVSAVGNGKYDISFSLIDVFRPAQSKITEPDHKSHLHVLATQTFKNIPKTEARDLAHHIDDIIYLQLTGKRGIFSTKIAYVLEQTNDNNKKRYLLEVSDYDGFNPKTVLSSSEPIMSPVWAPDARHIAYVSFEDRFAAIYMTDVITGKRHLISEFPGVNGAPAFSPNGHKMALVLTKTDQLKIYIMNIQNKKLEQVTHGYSIDTEPRWSPDGKSIIFTSDRAGGPQIYQVNLKKHHVERLTYDGDYNARASFTLDGKKLVLLHRDSGDSPYSIAIMDLATGVMRVLVQGYDVQSPSASPNGSMVIYSNKEDGKGILAEVSTDGKVQLRLPARNGDVREPAWSPYWDKL
jgi:TolB protein